MDEKFVKDTTKEDHYVKIAVGFKIIYNQNQYLAYTEMPKKKRDIPLEIYIGKVSRLKGNYLLFKCETDSERKKVFDLFRKVFSGELIEEIEMMDYSSVERMSIVSYDRFDEKMDQYPNFFVIPKKEDDINAEIPIPSFFKKKGSKIKLAPTEEIQFVENHNEVLESNVEESTELETPQTETETSLPSIEMPQVSLDSEPVENQVSEVEAQTVNQPVEAPQVEAVVNQPVEAPQVEAVVNQPVEMPQVEPVVNQPVEMPQVETVVNQAPVEMPQVETVVNQAPVGVPQVETVVNQAPVGVPQVETVVNQVPIEQTPVAPVPLDPNTVAEMNEEVKVTQVVEAGKKKKRSRNNGKKGHTLIIILMIITILLIAFVVIHSVNLKPQNEDKKDPKPQAPKTEKLICSIDEESNDFDGTEEKTVTMVYDVASKNILSSVENGIAKMRGESDYQERKATIIIFSKELKNTDGQKYSFRYDDENLVYRYSIERNYEKATETEKDETWLTTFDTANDYYLDKGYTCNGKKKDDSIRLTSTTGSETVDYNNWIVNYKSVKLSENKDALSITLDVKNNGTEKRTLNGEFKLFDTNSTLLKTNPFTREVEAGASISITVDISNVIETGTIDLKQATAYEIELFR